MHNTYTRTHTHTHTHTQALSKEELRDLDRLKGHELGAKADPAKFKSIFSKDKRNLLKEYKLRVEISAQIRNALVPVKVCVCLCVCVYACVRVCACTCCRWSVD